MCWSSSGWRNHEPTTLRGSEENKSPLEDLSGNKYISDLVPEWPFGSDSLSNQNNHTQGIKNVLQRTFPNISGPVTLTHDEINRGSVPAASVLLFYMASAPEGWVRTTMGVNDYMPRIVWDGAGDPGTAPADEPGTVAGTQSPVNPGGFGYHRWTEPTGDWNIVAKGSEPGATGNTTFDTNLPLSYTPRYANMIMCTRS